MVSSIWTSDASRRVAARLPAGSVDEAVEGGRALGVDVVLLPVAPSKIGRRLRPAPVLDERLADALAAQVAGPLIVPVIDHAGPAAALWTQERALGPSDFPEDRTDRRPIVLDEEGWARIAAEHARAATLLARLPIVVFGADDDGLFQSALSPRTNGAVDEAGRRARALHAFAAVRSALPAKTLLGVAIVVEELCPQGLDPTEGIAHARAFAAAGAAFLVASGGTAALPALKDRQKGRSLGPSEEWLWSAAWLVGAVDVPVIAQGPAQSMDAALAKARALGLDGVATTTTTLPPPATGPAS